jgi:signal transduction histidine kinase
LVWIACSAGDYLIAFDGGKSVPNHDAPGVSAHPRGILYRVLLFPRVVVEKAFAKAAVKADLPIPRYATVRLELSGREFTLGRDSFYQASDAPALPLLGDASGRLAQLPLNNNPFPFRVRVFLTDASILYARQYQRTLFFGGLILASLLAAIVGVVAARNAFRRQMELGEAKSNFVSSVSHELRAPIASVRLLAESLERGKVADGGKQREYFGFIVQECRRLSSLIENVLDFSRIEQGRKQYDFEPTDLRALAEQTVKLMEPYAAEKGVKLEFGAFNIQHSTLNAQAGADAAKEASNLDLRPSNFELLADGKALQQALVNLIDNAIKHSPKGATVTVELARREDNSPPADASSDLQPFSLQPSAFSLSVTDHGEGIPAEDHERIFERFFRRGSELRRETQGVGIGLSIVKHIVEAHGGRMLVRSAVGAGSRFTIELPATATEAQRRREDYLQ